MAHNILILLAHPRFDESKANAAMVKAASELTNVKVINIAKTPMETANYIDAVKKADVIVFQFPTWWMGAPDCLKAWEDKFMIDFMENPGFKDKKLLVATTTGSPEECYRAGGTNQFTIDELMRPYQASANYAGLEYLTPFTIYGTMAPGAENRIAKGAMAYKELLATL